MQSKYRSCCCCCCCCCCLSLAILQLSCSLLQQTTGVFSSRPAGTPQPNPTKHPKTYNLRSRVLDRLIDREDQACSLGRSSDGVDAHQGRLPHRLLQVVRDVLAENVDAEPCAVCKKEKGVIFRANFICMANLCQPVNKTNKTNKQNKQNNHPIQNKHKHTKTHPAHASGAAC